MDERDRRLFDWYVTCESAEAGLWNRSPRCLYHEYWTRDLIARWLAPFECAQVCNVGVGAGGWDNYLCDLLTGKGRLTSVDFNQDICRTFAYRQKREGHPNPSRVLCADVTTDLLTPHSFDVVTVIGSTATESGNYEGCLASSWRLVSAGGHMMFMDFDRSPVQRVEKWIASTKGRVAAREEDHTTQAYAFWIERF